MKLPHKILLMDQVASLLREEMGKGTWKEWLPAERELAEQIGVNRRTLRRAIHGLAQEGLLLQIPRKGNKIAAQRKKLAKAKQELTVGLLLPERTTPQPFSFDEILSSLQGRFLREGIRLVLHSGKQYFRRNPAEPLRQLVSRSQVDCWLLRFADGKVQNWFAQNGIPAVVWGRLAPGVLLPSISVDLAAIARHAAGTLLRLGHRRIGLLSEKDKDINVTRDHFREAIALARHEEAEVLILEHEANAISVRQVVQRSLNNKRRPSAFFMTRTYSYVAAIQLLAPAGLRVPQDISLICRDYDPLFPFMLPQPSHFRFRAEAFADQLHALISRVARGEIVLQPQVSLLPDFVAGASLGQFEAR